MENLVALLAIARGRYRKLSRSSFVAKRQPSGNKSSELPTWREAGSFPHTLVCVELTGISGRLRALEAPVPRCSGAGV